MVTWRMEVYPAALSGCHMAWCFHGVEQWSHGLVFSRCGAVVTWPGVFTVWSGGHLQPCREHITTQQGDINFTLSSSEREGRKSE